MFFPVIICSREQIVYHIRNSLKSLTRPTSPDEARSEGPVPFDFEQCVNEASETLPFDPMGVLFPNLGAAEQRGSVQRGHELRSNYLDECDSCMNQ